MGQLVIGAYKDTAKNNHDASGTESEAHHLTFKHQKMEKRKKSWKPPCRYILQKDPPPLAVPCLVVYYDA
jgi:hypothetical protein